MSVFPPRPRPLGKAAPTAGKMPQGVRTVPDAAQKTTVGFHATGLTNDRILFVTQVLVGCKVEVEVKDGTIYEGILHAMRSENKDWSVVMHWARPVKGPGAAVATPAVKQMVIPSGDFVQILAKNVDLSEEELSGPVNGANAFETDSEISKGRGGVERELTRWQPDSSVKAPDLSLDAAAFGRPNAGSITGWDQFETNRQKFQVKTSWDENLYTTKLDKSKAGISVAEAERIAAEIERQTTRNRHLAEERGLKDLSVQEIDEEELYSSVARGAPDEDMAARPADAANNDTFGADAAPADGAKPASASGRDPADAPRRAAWGNAGAGVAVVSGRGGSWEPPGKVRTAPVAVVDPRREHNKLRLQMTGGAVLKGKDRSSPSSYGTPKGLRSPLSSPLVGDSIQVEALDLNPGVARIDRKTRKEFEEFKTKRKEGSGAADVRTFGHELPSGGRKAASDQPVLSSSAGSSSKAGGVLSPASAPPSNSSFSSDAAPAAPSISAAAPGAAAASSSGAAGGQPSSGQPPRPPASKSTLNPDAKSFVFNPSAKEFKPTFSAATTPAATPFGTPAATPPATPASSVGGAGAFRTNSFGSSHFGGPAGASQWISQRSHSSPATGQRKFERQMEREGRMWEDGRGGVGGMEREHSRNGPPGGGGGPGGPPPHGGQMHPMSASAGLQMSAGPGHMGGPVGLPMAGAPGQWAVPQQFVPGQPFMPIVPGSPQQPQLMAYMGRPPYGPPPGGFMMRPGSMPGSPYGGGMMYAPAPPGMHPGGPGGPRAQMYPGPGMMMPGGPGMAPMGMPGPHMGMPGGPGGPHLEQQGGPPGGPHGSPEQRNRGPGGGHQFHSPTKP